MSFSDFLVAEQLVSARDLEQIARLALESDEALDVLMTRVGFIAE